MPPLNLLSPWQQHVARWKDCTKCPLCSQRDHIVLARGNIPCDVLFCGEAPGESENLLGQPFIGPAGHLLDQIVMRAVPQGTRCAYTNLVACFPRDAKHAGTNEPEVAEIRACSPRLAEFIGICKPKLLVAVGTLADTHVGEALGKAMVYANGRVEGHATIQQMVSIVHPAFILRAPVVQQGMAIQKSVVTISCAIENLV